MATILERNNKTNKTPKKTREEYAEDALYREVWEDVNNEKTQQFIKKYWKYILYAVLGIMLAMSGIQLIRNLHYKSQIATAQIYETAVLNYDAKALENMAKNTSGGLADLALFQSYVLDKDVSKLELLAKKAKSRDFADLAKVHLAAINGDKMTAEEFDKYLSGMNTKKSPFYYVSRLLVAEKYLSVSNREKANEILNIIIADKDAPASISTTAQTLR
ncbi:MAG: hypothetical protein MJ158_00650 [Alphaproteobacteria bacterium]|nr:hypothetical protein [Alphaproteobacteria bacterium]